MKLYYVDEWCVPDFYDYGAVIGVYTTKEKAIEVANAHSADKGIAFEYTVCECEANTLFSSDDKEVYKIHGD